METLNDAKPLLELGTSIMMLVVVILVHGLGLRAITVRFSRAWSRVSTRTPHWRMNLTLGGVIFSLAALHMLETLVFALPLYFSGIFAELRDSYYFVLESYTTLGAARSVSPPEQWRLIGPVVAMAGMFSFGWTGSVLVSIMNQFGRMDSQQAREALGDETDGRP